jgi:thiamine biosynthesis lipoprotein
MRRGASPGLARALAAGLAALALACGAAGGVPAAAGQAAAPAEAPRPVAYPTRTMGTYANVVIVTADSGATAPIARRAHAAFARIDSLMSNWTTTSEVARLNREAAAGATAVHPEVAAVLEAALRLWRESDGAFDITVEPLVRLWGFLGGPRRVPRPEEIAALLPHVGAQHLRYDAGARTLWFTDPGVRIDLGGIAKGYAVDEVARGLRAQGVSRALVDLTGNMVAIGRPSPDRPWRIGIRDPRGRMPYVARLEIHDEAISTSGQYEQFVAADGRTYGHILDPRTGRPVDGLISVTVVAPTALACDSWDTPLFVMGPERARRKARELAGIAAVLIGPGGGGVDTLWVEESLRGRFQLEPAARALFRVKYF